MSYPAYQSYKNSGIEWLGAIPSEWANGKVSFWFDVQLGKMLQPEAKSHSDFLKPYLRAANLSWAGVKFNDVKEMYFSPNDLLKYRLKRDDLLVCEGGDVGRSSHWNDDSEMYIQNAINRVRARPRISHSKFLYYWLSFLKSSGWIDIVCDSSTIAHLTAEKLEATKVFLPPHYQQKAIADFLDRKTAEIDALIEKKETLLDRLAEQRTALITYTVTKGLNPNAPMKDSGIEWLGTIPADWRVEKIKFNADVMTSNVNKKTVEGETKVQLCNYVDVYYNSKITNEIDFMDASASQSQIDRFTLLAQDVIFTKDSEAADDIGIPTFVPKSLDGVLCGYHLAIYRPNKKKLSGLFLYYILMSRVVAAKFEVGANGITRFGLSQATLNNIIVPLPSLAEQERIADRLDEQMYILDQTKDKLIRILKRLKEYRAALITNAVTGKIKVI